MQSESTLSRQIEDIVDTLKSLKNEESWLSHEQSRHLLKVINYLNFEYLKLAPVINGFDQIERGEFSRIEDVLGDVDRIIHDKGFRRKYHESNLDMLKRYRERISEEIEKLEA